MLAVKEAQVTESSTESTPEEFSRPKARAIHSEGSRVDVLVVPTNEELEIALQTLRCIQENTRASHPPR
jgi:acetate kinase